MQQQKFWPGSQDSWAHLQVTNFVTLLSCLCLLSPVFVFCKRKALDYIKPRATSAPTSSESDSRIVWNSYFKAGVISLLLFLVFCVFTDLLVPFKEIT